MKREKEAPCSKAVIIMIKTSVIAKAGATTKIGFIGTTALTHNFNCRGWGLQ